MTDRFDIDFPVFAKIDVNGKEACDLYQWLKTEQPGDVTWNFEKFLVNGDGEVVTRFPPKVTPEEIAEQLLALLS